MFSGWAAHVYKEIHLNLPLSYSKIEIDLSPTSKHHPNVSKKILRERTYFGKTTKKELRNDHLKGSVITIKAPANFPFPTSSVSSRHKPAPRRNRPLHVTQKVVSNPNNPSEYPLPLKRKKYQGQDTHQFKGTTQNH